MFDAPETVRLHSLGCLSPPAGALPVPAAGGGPLGVPSRGRTRDLTSRMPKSGTYGSVGGGGGNPAADPARGAPAVPRRRAKGGGPHSNRPLMNRVLLVTGD